MLLPDTFITELYSMLPPYFQQIQDFQQLMRVEELEFDRLRGYIVNVWNNLYIQKMDKESIQDMENRLRISHEDGDTLTFRRWRVLSRLMLTIPYTDPRLREYLNTAVGLGNWSIMKTDELHMQILITNITLAMYNEVIYVLKQMIPIHISTIFTYHHEADPDAIVYFGGRVGTQTESNVRE